MSRSSNEYTDERSEQPRLTESDRHRLLSARRRRVVLDVLDSEAPPVGTEELASAVARRENDGGIGDVEDVAITLRHWHLPTMADRGVIEYDPDSNRVESYRPLK